MCPICKVGEMIEWNAGAYCSRRYDPKARCDFESPWCDSPEEYQKVIATYRKQKRAAKRQVKARAMCAR